MIPGSVRMPDVDPVVAGVGDVLDADLALDIGDAASSDHSNKYLQKYVLRGNKNDIQETSGMSASL